MLDFSAGEPEDVVVVKELVAEPLELRAVLLVWVFKVEDDEGTAVDPIADWELDGVEASAEALRLPQVTD